MKNIRIAKFISDSGMASRRAAEQMIADGLVSVNGVKIDTPATFIDENDIVTVKGKIVSGRVGTHIYAFHKPINTITSTSDPRGRKTIYSVLPDKYKGLKYIGRLDFKTTGLLLLTDDGTLAQKMMLPSSSIERVYIAVVATPEIPINDAVEPARRGITIDGIKYRPMKIDVIDRKTLKITIVEGKKNEVRIVMDACGAHVLKLHRVSYGPIKLSDLAPGHIRELNENEMKLITDLI